jgi:tetratricopeptide (TPR) repeat protein
MESNSSPQPLTAIEGKGAKRQGRTLARAVSLHLEGKREAAANTLTQAIDGGERDPALFSALGHIQYELRDYRAAANAYQQLSDLEPMHRTAHFNLAICLGLIHEWNGAAESFHAASQADLTRADALLGQGIALLHARNPAEALEPLERYLTLFADHEQALFAYGVALQQLGKGAAAVEAYRKTLARNPRHADALSNLVALYLERQDSESVKRYAEMLIEVKHDSPVAMEALAALAFAAGDLPNAAQQCRNLVTASPDHFENWYNLGVAYHQMGNFGKAVEAYQRAITINPTSAQAHLNLGAARQETGDLAGARQSYEKALECEPNRSAAMWNLALALEQLGERRWAEKFYGNIPTDAPEGCEASFRAGYLQLMRGDFKKSAESFEACVTLRPEWGEAYLNAGIARARAGDFDAAQHSFTEALMLSPQSTDAARGLAALAVERQSFDEALDLHRELIKMGGATAEVFFNAGLLCQRRNQMDEAAEYYRHALEENASFAEALLNLGHVMRALQREDEAQSFWRRALREKPELAQAYFEPAT